MGFFLIFFAASKKRNFPHGMKQNEPPREEISEGGLETESIANCRNSVGLLSTRTIVEQHPWVTDAQTQLDALTAKAWTTDGRTFRARCWTNRQALVQAVHKGLTQSLLRGDSPARLTDAIAKQFSVDRYKAGRLVYTETAYYSALAEKQGYKVVFDSETYERPVDYLLCDKFISEYQGRIYRTEDFGIFKEGTFEIDESLLKEYFSEGFRAFYQEPALLKEKDPDLYAFIEELSDDKK